MCVRRTTELWNQKNSALVVLLLTPVPRAPLTGPDDRGSSVYVCVCVCILALQTQLTYFHKTNTIRGKNSSVAILRFRMIHYS